MLTLLYIVLAITYVIVGSISGTIIILMYAASERKDIIEFVDLAYNHHIDFGDVTEDDNQTAADVVALGIVLGFVVLLWPIIIAWLLITRTGEDRT